MTDEDLAQTAGPRDGDPVAHYLRVLVDKTGSLIATSARFGRMFGGAGPEVTEALVPLPELPAPARPASVCDTFTGQRTARWYGST